jgi:hypothetical protein
MLKKSASFVLARHCRLTISAAFTHVTRFIQRVVNLRGSTYRQWEKSLSWQAGAGRERDASPPRIAAAALDDLFDHPASVLNLLPTHVSLFQGQRNGFSTAC